jgi:glycosyltransferase involved in cell wall biosynthesis
LLSLSDCDVGVSPTAWQRSTYPKEYQDKIQVAHEGIDTEIFRPQQDAAFRLSSGRVLTSSDEVVTFVARNLEPLRGYHTFMRALPRILHERPRAQILIIGAEGTSYGRMPPENKAWRSIFFEEVADRVAPSRIHFTGPLSYRHYLRALQVSSAHVYLTYPFVLSWSLLEAMSAGCLVIGSDTAPVREVINGRNGVLTSFFDPKALAARVIEALARPNAHRGLRDEARRTVLNEFDLERVCLPKIIDILSQRDKVPAPSAVPHERVSKTNRNPKGRAASRLRDSAAGRLTELQGI